MLTNAIQNAVLALVALVHVCVLTRGSSSGLAGPLVRPRSSGAPLNMCPLAEPCLIHMQYCLELCPPSQPSKGTLFSQHCAMKRVRAELLLNFIR